MEANYELTVSTEDMQASAADFSRDMSDLCNVIESLRATVSKLTQSWEGEAMLQFQSQFNTLASNLENANKPMGDAANRLLQAADIYHEREKAASNASDLGMVNPYIN